MNSKTRKSLTLFCFFLYFSRKQIFLVCQCCCMLVSCHPGLVDLDDLPDFQKISTITSRGKSSFSTKPPSINSITDIGKSTTPASTTSGFHPLKFSQEDVIKGKNSIYGTQTRLSNGGIIFAFSQGQGQDSQQQQMVSACRSQENCINPTDSSLFSILAPPQPVLMQYLSEEGIPQQTAVQYIQLLRPVIMVPSSPYLPAKPNTEHPIQPTSAAPASSKPVAFTNSNKPSLLNPYGPYTRQPQLIDAYSSPHTSYNPRPVMQNRPTFDMALNMNEYMPSASSQMAILAPRSSITQFGQYAYKPTKFQARAQRA